MLHIIMERKMNKVHFTTLSLGQLQQLAHMTSHV